MPPRWGSEVKDYGFLPRRCPGLSYTGLSGRKGGKVFKGRDGALPLPDEKGNGSLPGGAALGEVTLAFQAEREGKSKLKLELATVKI